MEPPGEHGDERRWIAAILAIFGWRSSTVTSNSIECPEDGRTIGLWRFDCLGEPALTPAQATATTRADASPQQSGFGSGIISTVPAGQLMSRGTPETKNRTMPQPSTPLTGAVGTGVGAARAATAVAAIDPLGEHRVWSPWRSVVQGDTVPAWMRCLALVLGSAGRHGATRPSMTADIVRSSLAQI